MDGRRGENSVSQTSLRSSHPGRQWRGGKSLVPGDQTQAFRHTNRTVSGSAEIGSGSPRKCGNCPLPDEAAGSESENLHIDASVEDGRFYRFSTVLGASLAHPSSWKDA